MWNAFQISNARNNARTLDCNYIGHICPPSLSNRVFTPSSNTTVSTVGADSSVFKSLSVSPKSGLDAVRSPMLLPTSAAIATGVSFGSNMTTHEASTVSGAFIPLYMRSFNASA
jgi:hypothetical protein